LEKKELDLSREADLLVKATLIVKGASINDVPCKIYLPERTHEKPYVVFKPSREDETKIMSSHEGSLRAAIYGFDKELETTVEAPEVYFSRSLTKLWGDGISDTTIPGEPQDLHIIRHLRHDEGKEGTEIVFWISPNKFLTPIMRCSNSYTGEIKYELLKGLEFTINNNVKLVFEQHFASKTMRNRDLLQWSFLVACAKVNVPAADVETLKSSILYDIDDFLLLASFAARVRTACLGWVAIDKNSHATFYRGNYTFPESDDEKSRDDGVIDIQDFERFMEVCYSIFLRYDNKIALRNALYSAIPYNPSTIELSFLHMFAGLETLILEFRRKERLEFVLPEKDWLALCKYLQVCMKQSTEPKLGREQRASIYRKLGELNRVSLREAFDVFCQKYSIDLADLWPVFGEKGAVGLVDIRNRLIHGDPFPRDLLEALVVAKEHLKYVLERTIVRILGWDVGETKVRPTYLAMYFLVIKELPSEMARLSKYIYNQDATALEG
jgi:hypothetical protein